MGEGDVKNSEESADVLYGRPLSFAWSRHQSPHFLSKWDQSYFECVIHSLWGQSHLVGAIFASLRIYEIFPESDKNMNTTS